MLKGQLALESQGIDAVFVGMLGIEGDFTPDPSWGVDTEHPLVALALPWLERDASADMGEQDGRMLTWTSSYVGPDGTYHALTIPRGDEPVQHRIVQGTGEPGFRRAIGGLRDCPSSATLWRVGSADAVTTALQDPRFTQARASTEGVLVSALWMGEQVLSGCGSDGPPFWWIAYGDLPGAFSDPTPFTVARIDATTGIATTGQEWLRLRPAQDVALFEGAVTPAATGTTMTPLGDVQPLADSVSLGYDGGLGAQYDVRVVGPDQSYALGPMDALTGQGTWTLDDPAPGAWNLMLTPLAAAAAPVPIQVTFSALQ